MKSPMLSTPSSVASRLLFVLVAAALALTHALPAQSISQAQASDAPGLATRIAAAMKALRTNSELLGAPSVEGDSLFFGTTRINGRYTIVDGVAVRFGCTATFFVKQGADYIRVSTNVIHEGGRAIGTALDPRGAAFEALARGAAHYGIVEILGRRYQAGYEPIKNRAGSVIGAWYVGVPLEHEALTGQ